ncbi:hypothetical protein CGT77_13095 [Vibrio cholerae]|uniref:glycosyltransferase n=1 Tax=Vibrio cholerae TaxID=666 RepID=UPI0006E53520|nr:glycosyltransferase [Vibrio cholerae]EHY0936334.1 glycosyltransferase family 1 protein [Vibrio cholerae]EJL6615620.1 glycosyltransferase family 1 protein [Vibrio cholerae]KQA49454.1 hypothetical protein XV77_11800 [Vibrio cholerae]PAS07952.1 hypothetical protein CGT77_13095 [Vibrio cholerae]PAS15292.1 hypothetical protein CGT75_14590 [Vibrio cholerae]
MNVVFQPYYHWKGHFKKYSDSLVGNEDFLIESGLNLEYKSFVSYIILRFYLCFVSLLKLLKLSRSVFISRVYFIDIEPLALLLFLPFLRSIPKSVFTVHSVLSINYDRKVKRFISINQKRLLFFVLKKIKKSNNNVSFVVHSEVHRSQLIDVLGENCDIFVVEYPSPEPIGLSKKTKSVNPRFLVFGAMRQDKGIYEFILDLQARYHSIRNFKFYFVGKVYDKRIKDIVLPDNIIVIDEFVDDDKLISYVMKSDFFLLPYSENYTGGAGPLKDSTSFGIPAFTSNIPLFKEVSDKYNFSITFNSIDELISKSVQLTDEQYLELEINSKNFAKLNNWRMLRSNYEEVVR